MWEYFIVKFSGSELAAKSSNEYFLKEPRSHFSADTYGYYGLFSLESPF